MSPTSKILSSFIMAAMGVIFFFAGSLVADQGGGIEGGTTVEGTVIATPSGSEGTCGRRVRYFVDGVAYEASSNVSSSSACGTIGSTAKVSYLPSSPGTARVIDDEIGWFGLGFQVVGGGVILLAISQVVSAIRSVGAGRSDVAAGSVPGQETTDLGDLTLAGASPGATGAGGSTGHPPWSGGAPPPLPSPVTAQPPPGWYLDPNGTGHRRWWDGRVWTDHLR